MGSINKDFYNSLYWEYRPFRTAEFKPIQNLISINEKNNKEEENNMGEIDNILERYKKYQLEEIDFETDKKMKFLKESSDEYKIAEKIWKQAIKELKKIYPEQAEEKLNDLIYISIDESENTKKEIDILIDVREEKIKKIEEKIEDVKAMIAMADMFDEKMQVLKSYDIIDEEGRINKC